MTIKIPGLHHSHKHSAALNRTANSQQSRSIGSVSAVAECDATIIQQQGRVCKSELLRQTLEKGWWGLFISFVMDLLKEPGEKRADVGVRRGSMFTVLAGVIMLVKLLRVCVCVCAHSCWSSTLAVQGLRAPPQREYLLMLPQVPQCSDENKDRTERVGEMDDRSLTFSFDAENTLIHLCFISFQNLSIYHVSVLVYDFYCPSIIFHNIVHLVIL